MSWWICLAWFLAGVLTTIVWAILGRAGVFNTEKRTDYED